MVLFWSLAYQIKFKLTVMWFQVIVTRSKYLQCCENLPQKKYLLFELIQLFMCTTAGIFANLMVLTNFANIWTLQPLYNIID